MRLYLDTNVIMDFLCDRDSAAYQMVVDICANRHEVILSSLTIRELEKQGLHANTFITLLKGNTRLIFCYPDQQDRKAARRLQTHYADALHKVLASKHGADVLVTKNKKDFPFTDIAIKRPDEL